MKLCLVFVMLYVESMMVGVVLSHVPLVGVVVGCVYMCVLASLGGKMHILCDRCCPSAESSVMLGDPVSTLGLNCSVAQWWQTNPIQSDRLELSSIHVERSGSEDLGSSYLRV